MVTSLKKIFLLAFMGVLIALVFTLPDILGYLKSGKENIVYSGNSFSWDPWDINVYVSVIKYSQTNGFHYKNLYTLENVENKVVVYPFYTMLGTLFRNTNPFVIYHVFSFLLIFAAVVGIYWTTLKITANSHYAFLTALLVPFSGGFGWLLYSFKVFTPDLTTTPFIFANAFQRPHTMFALVSYIVALGSFFTAITEGGKKYWIMSYVCISLAMFTYPYLLLSFYSISFLFTLYLYINKKKLSVLKKILYFLGLHLPVGIVYSLYVLSTKGLDDVILPQLSTPRFYMFILGIGIFTIPLILLIKYFWKKTPIAFLFVWFAIHGLLAHLHFLGFSRYYFLGIFLPLTILSIYFLNNIRQTFKPAIIMFFTISATLTSILIIFNRAVDVQSKNIVFWEATDVQAIEYISKNIPVSKTILSSYPFANFVPVLTGHQVYFGHFYQTQNASEKINLLLNFYNNEMTENEAQTFLKENGIDYVIWKNEVKPWQNFPLLGVPKYHFLKEVFSNSDYQIFETLPQFP